ncbi:hypothetical protein [Streptomyces aureocirculatus]|uniref:hypothetical protein n=1 Tax=Streptomyces aureocirculatus TaxID=67275 RepID=UPI0004CAD3C0|nr:hypothetical protein [Streptomyces aureocirculatus]
MTIPTTAQRLIDFREELAADPSFGEELLNEILRDAARATIEASGLMTHPDLANLETATAFPRTSRGVGESKSPG